MADDILADGLMTVRELCAFTGMQKSYWYALMDSGDLPYVKLGGSRRIPRRAVLDYCAQHLMGGHNTRLSA